MPHGDWSLVQSSKFRVQGSESIEFVGFEREFYLVMI